MYLKIFVVSLSMSFLAHAESPDLSAKKYVRDKYFKGTDTMLTLIEDKSIPFASAKLYRVRPLKSKGGWTILVDEEGKSATVAKTSLTEFLGSLKSELGKMKFSNEPNEAVKISNGLLNHLSTARRNVNCADEKGQKNCELSFSEGEFAGQKASLIFDQKSSSIKVK